MLHHKPLTMGQSATSEIPPPHPAPAGSLGHARQRELAKGQASAAAWLSREQWETWAARFQGAELDRGVQIKPQIGQLSPC